MKIQWILLTLMLLTVSLITYSQSEDVDFFDINPLYHYDDSEYEEMIYRQSTTETFTIEVTSDSKNCVTPFVPNGKMGALETIDGRAQFKEYEGGTRIEEGLPLLLRCDEKYEPFGTMNPEEKLTCDRGIWERNPKCVPASCREPPPQVANAHQLTSNASHGAKMLYYCIKDFRKSRFEDIKCDFGVWTGNLPECKDTRCDANNVVFAGVRKELGKRFYKSLESYTPICEEGFSAVEPDNRLVCINEEWQGHLPPCKLAPVSSYYEEEESVITSEDEINKVVHLPTVIPVTTSQTTTTKPTFVPLPPAVKGSEISAYACENARLSVKCEAGKVIHILRANYGRTSTAKCNRDISLTRNVGCLSANSEEIMKEKCDKKQSCEIAASNAVFGDPCVGTIKYLEMQYQCVPGNEFSVHVCENSRLVVECERGTIIEVLRANYGRTSTSKCNIDSSRTRNVGCLSEKSGEIIREKCDHKRSCIVEASNSVFGDPCYGTVKYFEIEYECVPDGGSFHETSRPEITTEAALITELPSDPQTSGNEISLHVCENARLSVKCDPGKVIRILGANYGRTSTSKCNGDSSLTRNVRCRSDKSKEIMREKCDRRPSCEVEASNSVFGDPCHGTIKYLEIQYQCVPGKDILMHACENARLELKCEAGKVIHILGANYGRTSTAKCNRDIARTRNVRCVSARSREILREKCDQKRSCDVEASNSVFGDPCYGTVKYLETEYECIPEKSRLLEMRTRATPEIPTGQTPAAEQASHFRSSEMKFACENTMLGVECGAGKVIRFLRANYGRRTSSKCRTHADILRSLNVGCVSDKANDIMRAKCDHKRSCIVEASNSVFGDPCYGTIKYLEMEYECVPGLSGCPPIRTPAGSQLMLHPDMEFYRIGQLVTLSCPPGLVLSSETTQVRCIGGEWSTRDIPHCITEERPHQTSLKLPIDISGV